MTVFKRLRQHNRKLSIQGQGPLTLTHSLQKDLEHLEKIFKRNQINCMLIFQISKYQNLLMRPCLWLLSDRKRVPLGL